jgi:mannitol-1-phosphate 5-dehydrogenase
MKKAVMYGAGNIGRGFIGKVFSESGYEVCFIDVDDRIVSEINRKKEYPVKIVANYGNSEQLVKNVRVVSGYNVARVAEEMLLWAASTHGISNYTLAY